MNTMGNSGPLDTGAAAQTPLRAFAWAAFGVLTTIAGALLFWQFRTVLILLVAALVLAASIRPIAGWLTAHGLRRNFATTMLVLLVVAGLLVIVGFSAYILAEDLPRAATELQMKYAQMRNGMAGQSGWQGTLGQQLPAPEGLEDLIARLQLQAGESTTAPAATILAGESPSAGAAPATSNANGAAGVEQTAAPGATAGSSTSATTAALTTSGERASGLLRLFVGTTSSVLGLFTQFIVLVFLSLYWSLDREWFERLWLSLLPADKRGSVRNAWHKIDDGVGAHVRSEFVQAFIAFVLLYAGFRLMGAEYPLLMAWAAALAWMIPLLGGLLALVPVLLIGLLSGPVIAFGASLYLILVLAVLEFGVEPRLDMRRRAGSIVGLIVALVMLQAFGIVGLIVASPLAVAVDILAGQWNAPRVATVPPAQPVPTGSFEQMEARINELRAAMGKVDEDIPLKTRSLYERLQTLLIDAEKVL